MGQTQTGVFTISPQRPFLTVLARALIADAGTAPDQLADTTVLLPTRRAVRALREAFLDARDGAPLILPRLLALGDLDEEEATLSALEAGFAVDIPPPIAPLKRQLMLAAMILTARDGGLGALTPDQAVRLAAELASLLDQVQTERLSFDGLARLVPEDYATHWGITLDFLKLITDLWPGIVAEEGCIDPAVHRDTVFAALGRAWRDNPPPGPVIAAGSTGSVPATADLLAVVADLPQGCVILPGLDTGMSEAAWTVLDAPHPQFGLKQLLARLNRPRAEVAEWRPDIAPANPVLADRGALISHALLPAAEASDWRTPPAVDRAALADMTLVDCPDQETEARTIALYLRAVADQPARTAALITPDRTLARRVAAEMARWNLAVDDSAGTPLSKTPPGVFLLLLAEAAASDFAPVDLLALLKHPLCGAGYDPGTFRRAVRLLEIHMLRGPRPATTLADLPAAARKLERTPPTAVLDLLDRLAELLAPLETAMAGHALPFTGLLDVHVRTAEALAASDSLPGPARLWVEDAGEAAAAFLADLARHATLLPDVSPTGYAPALEALMDARPVRAQTGQHPRLAIWGPLEARLQRPDLIIMGGLTEGTWPRDAADDPWMSRPMRTAFGLPAPERRIGLAAHDFAQACGADQVVMTSARKVDGSPAITSRWLLRLTTVAHAAGLAFNDPAAAPHDLTDPAPLWPGAWMRHWAQRLDRPDGPARPASAPAPRPPLTARPDRLYVTRIEMWMRDAYAFYAREILRLKRLEDLDADPQAAEYGNLIHTIVERFRKAYPADLPGDALPRLLAMGEQAFADQTISRALHAFWWPRFERSAVWLVEQEAQRRNQVSRVVVEAEGETAINVAGTPFTLAAKADRIDLLTDGTLAIIDYKTGEPPSAKQVAAGFAPQLPLEAVIAQAGGFAEVSAAGAQVSDLLYWRLGMKGAGGKEVVAAHDAQDIIDQAREGLIRLVTLFRDEATPYSAQSDPGRGGGRYAEYAHLARLAEWAEGGGEDGA